MYLRLSLSLAFSRALLQKTLSVERNLKTALKKYAEASDTYFQSFGKKFLTNVITIKTRRDFVKGRFVLSLQTNIALDSFCHILAIISIKGEPFLSLSLAKDESKLN